MTITGTATTAGRTYRPADEVPTFVPAQPGPGERTGAANGPMPSLRSLGVDTRTLVGGSPRAVALRCSSCALSAAQHLLSKAAPSPTTLAQVVESDPVLALRVLHLANQQVARGFSADTIPQAIDMLGPAMLGSLVDELLLDATLGAMDGLWRVLARALTCEGLSGDRIAFTAGLLSGLADALGVPAAAVLEVAGVSREVVDAVRFGTGPWGPVLRAAVACERNDPAGVVRSGLAPVDVYDAYLRGATEAMATAQAVGSS
jgi:c-di-GMP-related signal transduction protein